MPLRSYSSHIVDNRFHGGGYATTCTKEIFHDERRLSRWIEIEIALAECQGELGIIPADVAVSIAKTVHIEAMDLERIAKGIEQTNHSLVPLLQEMSLLCGNYASQFLHYGATTQDIQDTSQSLEMRDVLGEIEHRLRRLVADLSTMANAYRDTLMVGRTHSRAALPTTFGLKVAGWVDSLTRDFQRLREMRPRVLVSQLFGGVGTMSAFGEHGVTLLQRFSERLGLEVPSISWHVSRDRVVEFVSNVALMTGTLSRIADEVRVLGRPEFGELKEVFPPGLIGSSTMPHKQNPEACEQIVVLSRLCKAQVGVAFDTMLQEHERDYRGTRLEWVAVPSVSHYAVTALDLMQMVIDRLEIRPEKMTRNVATVSAAICSEALMLKLGYLVGKSRAFSVVRSLSEQARSQAGETLGSLALKDALITKVMTEDEIRAATDPSNHVGATGALIDQTIRNAREHCPSSPTPVQVFERTQRHPRYEILLKAEGIDDVSHKAFVSNLSKSGMQVDIALNVGERSTLQLSFPGLLQPVRVTGHVRWNRPADSHQGAASGIEFSELSPEAERLISSLTLRAESQHDLGVSRILLFEADPFLHVLYEEQLRGWAEVDTKREVDIVTVRDVGHLRAFLDEYAKIGIAILDFSREPSFVELLSSIPEDLVAVVLCHEAQLSLCPNLERPNLLLLTKPIHYGRLVHTVSILARQRNS